MSVMPERWSRISSRVIWVDLVITATLWLLIGIAAFGILSAVLDAVRWVFTFYRITDSHIELPTGVLFRQHRSIPSDLLPAQLDHRRSGPQPEPAARGDGSCVRSVADLRRARCPPRKGRQAGPNGSAHAKGSPARICAVTPWPASATSRGVPIATT